MATVINNTEYIDFYQKELIVFYAQQFDKNTRTITLIPKNAGEIMNFDSSVWQPTIMYYKPDGFLCYNNASFNSDGSIVVTLTDQMLAAAGRSVGQLVLTNLSDNTIIKSTTFEVQIDEAVENMGDITSSSEMSALQEMIDSLSHAYEQVQTIIPLIPQIETAVDDVEAAEARAEHAAELLEDANITATASAQEAESYATSAGTASTNANNAKLDSEAWAVGTKNGVPVSSSDDQYNNSAYYWAQQAAAANVGVSSFNGRAGIVVPASGDYASNQITFNNSGTNLSSTNVEAAIKELETDIENIDIIDDSSTNTTTTWSSDKIVDAIEDAGGYVPTPATSSTLGCIKSGGDISVSASGSVTVNDSDKVNGHTVGVDVPADAVFTDTTYSEATTSSSGLMSSAMVTKLAGISDGATANNGTVTSITFGNGLSGGTISSSGSVGLETVTQTNTSEAVTTSHGSTLSAIEEITVDSHGIVTGCKTANITFTDNNSYHKTGTWSGLTYTATSVGGAEGLAFTIPTGTSANDVAVGNHTHLYAASSSAGGSATNAKLADSTTQADLVNAGLRNILYTTTSHVAGESSNLPVGTIIAVYE